MHCAKSVAARGYIDRYRALIDGFRSALTPAWRDKAVFIGYEAFGPPHYARWSGWPRYSEIFDQYIDNSPFMWGGAAPSYYLQDWNASRDDQIFGPQGEAQNQAFMLDEAYASNPNFWFELSIWDGDQIKRDSLSDIIPFTTDRYKAMAQFGMWLLRPRVIREFRHSTETFQSVGIWFEALQSVIDKI